MMMKSGPSLRFSPAWRTGGIRTFAALRSGLANGPASDFGFRVFCRLRRGFRGLLLGLLAGVVEGTDVHERALRQVVRLAVTVVSWAEELVADRNLD